MIDLIISFFCFVSSSSKAATAATAANTPEPGAANASNKMASKTATSFEKTDSSHVYGSSLPMPSTSSSSSSSSDIISLDNDPVKQQQQQKQSNVTTSNLLGLDLDDLSISSPSSANDATKIKTEASDLDFLMGIGSSSSNNNNNNSSKSEPALLENDLLNLNGNDKGDAENEGTFDPLGSFEVSTSPKQTTFDKLSKSPGENLTTASRPNYFLSSDFSANNQSPTVVNKHQTPASNANALFDAFLPQDFIKSTTAQTSKANMTLKDLKGEKLVKELDPDTLKVMEWTEGKKANIRALLCSLHKILWEGETRWKPIGMHQLVTADDVKRMHKRAVLVVHPDKLTDHPQLNLARMIFVELNEAWTKFSNESQQNLF